MAKVCRMPVKPFRRDSDDVSNFATVEEYLAATHDSNPQMRKRALKSMCPCKVLKEIDMIWERVFEMVKDPDPVVRYQVLHTLCDGSPREREEQVIAALESLWNDEDDKIRRAVRRALNEYRRTGNWNIL